MLINETRKIVLAKRVEEATNVFKRTKGLLGRKNLDEEDALILFKCRGVHTYFMGFNIDVIFLDRNKKVISIIRNLPPWRTTKLLNESYYIIEMQCNSTVNKVEVSDFIRW